VFAGNAGVTDYLEEKERRYREDSGWSDPATVELVCRGAAAYPQATEWSMVPHSYGTWYHTSGFSTLLAKGSRFEAPAPGLIESETASVVTQGTAAPKIPVVYETLEGGERVRYCTQAVFAFPVSEWQSKVEWELKITYLQDRTLRITGAYEGTEYGREEGWREPFLPFMRQFLSPYVDAGMEEELWERGVTRSIAMQILRKEHEESPECREAVGRVAAYLGCGEEELFGQTGEEMMVRLLGKLFPAVPEEELRRVDVGVVSELDPEAARAVLGLGPAASAEEITRAASSQIAEITARARRGEVSSREANAMIERIRRTMYRASIRYTGPGQITEKLARGLTEEEGGVLVAIMKWWREQVAE
jgi:hypothetical protein